ncbi:UNVERIFIED_CONTAM: type I restriction endonuclease [Campylobacter lari]
MKSNFNEETRVQIPALVHLTRLGYKYIDRIKEYQAGRVYDVDTNILLDIFKQQFVKLNPDKADLVDDILIELKNDLYNDDLGKSFYKKLVNPAPYKLIDFENPENNEFHATSEFTCKNELDEFRPDITLFINGLPLVFIEVKKPNNEGGLLSEINRLNNRRLNNPKFRRFLNITQLMIFSNNMEYDHKDGIVPIEGVFYCTNARNKASVNCFREENPRNYEIAPFNSSFAYAPIDEDAEKSIFADFHVNKEDIQAEYNENININTPTNRTLTSMCSKERLLYILKYGIAYVNIEKTVDGKIETIEQKQIIRYQQLFAALAICKKLDEGKQSGVV